MKIKYLKLKNWLYVALGGMLGINLSCDKTPPIACEYGAPEATYTVKGQVTNQNQEPISGIRVKMNFSAENFNDDVWGTSDVVSDSNGRYDISTYQFPYTDTMYLKFSDVDGEENGVYADTVVHVLFKDAQFTGGDGSWYWGAATVTKDVQLRRVDGE